MAVPGAFYGAMIGPDVLFDTFGASGISTYAMAALNTGWCGRFTATQAKDVKSAKFNFSAVSSAGVITLRIETIDATTGKPSGSLYDAAATKTFTPVAGWQTVTFDSLPTTNLTVGAEYAIVLLTTTGGTTQTLRGHCALGAASSVYPTIALTASDGTTRSNFAEVAGTIPLCSLVLEDDTEDPMGMMPCATSTTHNIFGTAALALKVTTVGTLEVLGTSFTFVKVGTPAGDLRVRIFDGSNNVVTNGSVTIDKDSISTAGTTRRQRPLFPGLASLTAGTYRVVLDSPSSVDSSNCWRVLCPIPVTTAVVPANYVASTCPDVGTPVWTDSATADQPPIRLVVNNITAGASSTGVPSSSHLNGLLQCA